MVGYEIKTLIGKHLLPKTLTLPNGDVVTGIVWSDWEERVRDSDKTSNPYGRFRAMPTRRTSYNDLEDGLFKQVDATRQDSYTMPANESVHVLDYHDVITVTNVDDGATTYAEDIDYEIHTTSGAAFPNAIKWIDGGAQPAQGTTVTIDYTTRTSKRARSSYIDRTYRLYLHVQDQPNGQDWATRDYPKAELGELLTDAMYVHASKLQGTDLAVVEAKAQSQPLPDAGEAVCVGRVEYTAPVGIPPGENRYICAIDVMLGIHFLSFGEEVFRQGSGYPTVSL